MSDILLYEGVTPPPPPAGTVLLYPKVDGRFYFMADDGIEVPMKPVGVGTGDLLSDGTVGLTANWDLGAFKLTALQFESDVVTGTAPFVVASTTMVSSLNVQFLNGIESTDFDIMAFSTDSDDLTEGAVNLLLTVAERAAIAAISPDADWNVQSGTTYTLQASDNGKNVGFTNAVAIAVTLPDTLATDFHCNIFWLGVGKPTVTPNTDTVNGAAIGVFPDAQWKAMYLSQFAAAEWVALF